MQSLVLGVESDGAFIVLTGATQELWRSRRAAIYFRDYLGASLGENHAVRIPVADGRIGPLVRSIEEALTKGGFASTRSEQLSESVADFQRAEDQFSEFSSRARSIWANKVPPAEFREFAERLTTLLPGRRLYDLQLLAAYHLAFAQNAANFSAPGVGKTSIVYGAFAYLNSLGEANQRFVNRLLVIGPLSSFGPWESEFRECFSRNPISHRLSIF